MNFTKINMVDKKNKTLEPSKDTYSLERLWNDISAQYDKDENDDEGNDMRDKMQKYKVFSHLINLAEKTNGYDEADICDVVKLSEEQHNALFAYTLFLSVNPQFDYSWSFLRKQWDSYIETLGNLCVFINQFVSHVNTIQNHSKQYIGMTFVFANVLKVSLDKKTQDTEVEIIWDNFDSLLKINKEYTISAKLDATLVLSSIQKVRENKFGLFLGKVNQLIQAVE